MTIKCCLCGLTNRGSVPVRLYHLRPTGGRPGRRVQAHRGAVYVGKIALCDRCVTEQQRGAEGSNPFEQVSIRRGAAAMSGNGSVESAIGKVLKRKKVRIGVVGVKLVDQPIMLTESHQVGFTRAKGSEPHVASLLLLDPKLGAYRAVIAPPGTSWELVEKKQGPAIWTPTKTS